MLDFLNNMYVECNKDQLDEMWVNATLFNLADRGL